MVLGGPAPVQRHLLREVADLREEGVVVRRAPAGDGRPCPRSGGARAGEQAEQRRLAGAVAAHEPGDRARRDGDRAVAQRPRRAEPLAQPLGLDTGPVTPVAARPASCRTSRAAAPRSRGRRGRRRAASATQRPSAALEVGERPRRRAGAACGARTSPRPDGPRPGPRARARGTPLDTVFGIDRELRDDVLDRRQLVAGAQRAGHQGLAHLVGDLPVRRPPRLRIEPERDHQIIKSLGI